MKGLPIFSKTREQFFVNNLNTWDYAMLAVGALGVFYATKHSGISRYAGIGLAGFAAYYVYTDYAAA